jgi:hypothetical protein
MKKFLVVTILLSLCAYNIVALSEENKTVGLSMPELRAMLLDMKDRDQAVRKTMMGNASPSEKQLESMRDLDATHTDQIKKIYAQHGWPTSSMIGRDGVLAFWFLAQHSPDSDFQRTLLPHVKTAFEDGELSGQYYAMFVDRTLVRDGKPQIYGTQIEMVNNKPVPLPIENQSNVNAVRASIGLPTLEEYLKFSPYSGEKSISPVTGKKSKNNTGIGVELDIDWVGSIENMRVRSLTVLKVYEGSSADKAGIIVNDQLIEIDGIPVAGSLMDTLVSAMDKPVGDRVALVIKRSDGSKNKVSVELTASKSE